MASFPSRFCVCALALGSSALAAQDGRRGASEILLDLQSFEIDNKTNLIHALEPRITQGDMSIAADEAFATGTDFKAKSEWKFNGHVKITLDSAIVTADSAVFTFDDNQLARGELAGNATFEDARRSGEEPARGGAGKIAYDYTARTVRLTQNAWFHRGRYQANGCDIVYNLGTEDLTSGSADCSDRFTIRVLPEQGENAAGADPPQ
jgi:lipopolysaccharide transport protein LptA